jgi:hypothetical protein
LHGTAINKFGAVIAEDKVLGYSVSFWKGHTLRVDAFELHIGVEGVVTNGARIRQFRVILALFCGAARERIRAGFFEPVGR